MGRMKKSIKTLIAFFHCVVPTLLYRFSGRLQDSTASGLLDVTSYPLRTKLLRQSPVDRLVFINAPFAKRKNKRLP